MIDFTATTLTVSWPDGLNHVFHPLWLRERSFETCNKDPHTGHRLEVAAFLPIDIGIAQALEKNNGVEIAFSDGHSCRYSLDDLRQQALNLLPSDLIGTKQLWDSTLESWPRHEAAQIVADDSALLAMIDDLARLGFALVGGLGEGEDDLARLCDRIGPMRPTNWGTIADIKSIANAYDLSMTGRALEPHVDNPYRLPGPGYIFLHCLENSAKGGDSFIIDGFMVASNVKKRDPEAFATLVNTLVGFHYADDDAILDHFGPLLELGPNGDLHRVRFHNRADQVPAYSCARLSMYYNARRVMAEEVWSETNTLRFRLDPGEAYIVDNYRLFHGRSEIELTTGNRHMRQCYMDRDAVSSCQKIMRRRLGTKAAAA